MGDRAARARERRRHRRKKIVFLINSWFLLGTHDATTLAHDSAHTSARPARRVASISLRRGTVVVPLILLELELRVTLAHALIMQQPLPRPLIKLDLWRLPTEARLLRQGLDRARVHRFAAAAMQVSAFVEPVEDQVRVEGHVFVQIERLIITHEPCAFLEVVRMFVGGGDDDKVDSAERREREAQFRGWLCVGGV